MSDLPPLKEVDPEGLALGKSETTQLNFPKCKHELYVVSSTQARCKKCPVGYSGPNIISLVKASQQTS